MGARPLRKMGFGHGTHTGGSHAPTPSDPRLPEGLPPRRRTPAGPPPVQELVLPFLSAGPQGFHGPTALFGPCSHLKTEEPKNYKRKTSAQVLWSLLLAAVA